MAEMLRDADSTEKHIAVVWRHMRLCTLVKGAAKFRVNITPAYEKLVQCETESKKAVEAQENARDTLTVRGYEAADLLRDISDLARLADREAAGSPVSPQIYKEGGFGVFLNSQGICSAASARTVAQRIESLGPGHSLAPKKDELYAAEAAIVAAEQALEAAVREKGMKHVEEELAQAALRKAYEVNALDSRKELGKRVAERLFPPIRKRVASVEEEKGESDDEKDEGEG